MLVPTELMPIKYFFLSRFYGILYTAHLGLKSDIFLMLRLKLRLSESIRQFGSNLLLYNPSQKRNLSEYINSYFWKAKEILTNLLDADFWICVRFYVCGVFYIKYIKTYQKKSNFRANIFIEHHIRKTREDNRK